MKNYLIILLCCVVACVVGINILGMLGSVNIYWTVIFIAVLLSILVTVIGKLIIRVEALEATVKKLTETTDTSSEDK